MLLRQGETDRYIVATGTARRLWTPNNFDPTIHLEPDLIRYADHARWIMSAIYCRTFRERLSPGASVPLMASILSRRLGGGVYARLLRSMEGRGVLTIDRECHPSGKGKRGQCRGYALTAAIREGGFRLHEVTSRTLIKSLAKWEAEKAHLLSPEHAHVVRHLAAMDLDMDGAREAITRDVERHNAEHPESPKDLDRRLAQLKSFESRDELPQADDNGRIYTCLCNMSRVARHFVTVGGENIALVDISCSQPLFLGQLFLAHFNNPDRTLTWEAMTSHQGLEDDKAPKAPRLRFRNGKPESEEERGERRRREEESVRSQFSVVSVETESLYSRRELPEDFLRYMDDVQGGQLYERLMAASGIGDREEVKRQLMKTVLSCRIGVTKGSRMGKAFAMLYPSVHRFILKLKQGDYRRSVWLTTRAESAFVFGRVIRRIMHERPTAWVSSVHDAVACLADDVPWVHALMLEEFALLGLKPTVKTQILARPLAGP